MDLPRTLSTDVLQTLNRQSVVCGGPEIELSWDQDTLELQGQFEYKHEGWGMTTGTPPFSASLPPFTAAMPPFMSALLPFAEAVLTQMGAVADGKQLIVSDGSAYLHFWDPDTFEETRKVPRCLRARERITRADVENEGLARRCVMMVWRVDDVQDRRIASRMQMIACVYLLWARALVSSVGTGRLSVCRSFSFVVCLSFTFVRFVMRSLRSRQVLVTHLGKKSGVMMPLRRLNDLTYVKGKVAPPESAHPKLQNLNSQPSTVHSHKAAVSSVSSFVPRRAQGTSALLHT